MSKPKLTRQDPEYWRRKHAKGIEKMKSVECTYWACPFRTIQFAFDTGRKENDESCICPDPLTGKVQPRNMAYWFGMEAPNWCPRRVINGGTV